ncbi:unnamed protein product, partial [Schistocephalus solidus]|uniref:Fucosyltransferase n=1 Tax=Schistocephalus solidus TaxID=70667 RepID=A0A183SXD2_SCHSO
LTQNRQPRSIPLIYYSNRILYHPVFTGGCAYKCRYTHKITDLRRAQLAVFLEDVPAEAYTVGKGAIWAFESGEPIHLLPRLSNEAKQKISMYITHHTFASVTYYYGVYWAHEKPECVMSKAEKLRLKSQNSLRLLPNYHFQRKKMIAWVVSNADAPNRRKALGAAITKVVLMKVPNFPIFDRVGMVPIVYGPPKEEYEARAPPNSFIHVDDFATVNDLIQYLEYLDHNHTAYATYFAWREHGRLLVGPLRFTYVIACDILYLSKQKPFLKSQCTAMH